MFEAGTNELSADMLFVGTIVVTDAFIDGDNVDAA